MKVKPILFKTEMVQAILDGRKTQTRRVVKEKSTALQWINMGFTAEDICCEGNRGIMPYSVGDILWIRETFYAFGKWVKNGTTKKGKQKYRFNDFTLANKLPYEYESTVDKNINKLSVSTKKDGAMRWYKRPSLFMPFVAARIFLEITNVMVERLQDISEEDAVKEGIDFTDKGLAIKEFKIYTTKNWWDENPIKSFQSLWQSINGIDSWNNNPFVWVYSFKVVNKPQL